MSHFTHNYLHHRIQPFSVAGPGSLTLPDVHRVPLSWDGCGTEQAGNVKVKKPPAAVIIIVITLLCCLLNMLAI